MGIEFPGAATSVIDELFASVMNSLTCSCW